MIIDLNNKTFKPQSNTSNGEVTENTTFHYEQSGNIVSATYMGDSIVKGQLIGKIVNDEYLEFVYQHINIDKEIMTGKCKSYPGITESGKIQLTEYWQWTCKDNSTGQSIIIEI
jgi:hypothetical protein